MNDAVWVLIPLMALAIPLTAVVGRVVVKPIVDAITRLPASQQAKGGALPDATAQELEARIASLEKMLEQVQDEQEFQRKLLASRAESARPPEPR